MHIRALKLGSKFGESFHRNCCRQLPPTLAVLWGWVQTAIFHHLVVCAEGVDVRVIDETRWLFNRCSYERPSLLFSVDQTSTEQKLHTAVHAMLSGGTAVLTHARHHIVRCSESGCFLKPQAQNVQAISTTQNVDMRTHDYAVEPAHLPHYFRHPSVSPPVGVYI